MDDLDPQAIESKSQVSLVEEYRSIHISHYKTKVF